MDTVSKSKRKRKRRSQSQARTKGIRVLDYEITTEAITDARYRRLPRPVRDAFERLHYQSQTRPRKAIPELLEWIEQYPRMPMLYNYLSVAYSVAGQKDKMRAAVEENYRRNPDYLFARINYAQLSLADGDYERVAEILDHKFDLKLLYPKRKRFHISEFANFAGLVGVYSYETGDRELAATYYELLKQTAPGYPATKQLRRKLHPGPLRRLLLRLAGRS
jgi:tetratricopeptide (TPR) repeat protein